MTSAEAVLSSALTAQNIENAAPLVITQDLSSPTVAVSQSSPGNLMAKSASAESSSVRTAAGQVGHVGNADFGAPAISQPRSLVATGSQPKILLGGIAAPLPFTRGSRGAIVPGTRNSQTPEAQLALSDSVPTSFTEIAENAGGVSFAAKTMASGATRSAQNQVSGPGLPILDRAKTKASSQSISQFKQTGSGIEFEVGARVNDLAAGRLPLLIAGADAKRPDRISHEISVRVIDIINLLGSKMEPELLAKLSSSSAAAQYVTLNELRSSGITVSFDKRDRLLLRAN
jgi:hypothetical protein